MSTADFSEIKTMDMDSKTHLLEYLCNLRDVGSLSEEEAVVASKILLERMNNPGFIPKELERENWH